MASIASVLRDRTGISYERLLIAAMCELEEVGKLEKYNIELVGTFALEKSQSIEDLQVIAKSKLLGQLYNSPGATRLWLQLFEADFPGRLKVTGPARQHRNACKVLTEYDALHTYTYKEGFVYVVSQG